MAFSDGFQPMTGRDKPRQVSPAIHGNVPGDDDWPVACVRPTQPFDLWTRANVAETWAAPVTPLTWYRIPALVDGGIRYSMRGLRAPYLQEIAWVKRWCGRVYFNEGAMTHVLRKELRLSGSFLDTALGSNRETDGTEHAAFNLGRLLPALPPLARVMRGHRQDVGELEAAFAECDRRRREFGTLDLEGRTDAELWAELETVWLARFSRLIDLHDAISASAMMTFGILRSGLASWGIRAGFAQELLTGLSDVHAAEMAESLDRLARAVHDLGMEECFLQTPSATVLSRLRHDPAMAPIATLFDALLDRHGHRCPNETEWLNPRWCEDPGQVIALIAGYLNRSAMPGLRNVSLDQKDRRTHALSEVAAKLGPVRRWIIRRLLTRAQHLVRLRDNGRYYLAAGMFPFCRVFRTLGHRWARRGWIRDPADFFFLSVPDIVAVLDRGAPMPAGKSLLSMVSARREAYDYWCSSPSPEVIDSDGRPVSAGACSPKAEVVLCGLPVSGGTASGIARVILHFSEAGKLRPGDILVTKSTDPGWTPLFPLVRGLVLEVGGVLSHASIVAREYGIPAVANIPDATKRIRDGQPLVVDGTAGKVFCSLGCDGGVP